VTHFLRVVRGVLLKGATFPDVAQSVAILGLIVVVVSTFAMLRYRTTLD
jgi:ABC-2 type transport system permease protein